MVPGNFPRNHSVTQPSKTDRFSPQTGLKNFNFQGTTTRLTSGQLLDLKTFTKLKKNLKGV
jgi:hypothetical protein